MKEQQLSKDASVYHYRLLKRIHYKRVYLIAYWALLIIIILWDLMRWKPLPLLVSLITIPILQTLLIYLYFTLKEKRPLHAWSMQYKLPWLGYVPTNYISLQRMLKLHFHLGWVITAICVCFYPWVTIDFILHLVGIHLWVLVPRFILMLKFRHFYALGYLKLNDHDLSCYTQ